MDKIFDGAKFGDKFVTKGGKEAIYAIKSNSLHWLLIENTSFTWGYNDDGKLQSKIDESFDIVSHYKEPIDEKELNDLSIESAPLYCYAPDNKSLYETWKEAYKAGYHKAKEE